MRHAGIGAHTWGFERERERGRESKGTRRQNETIKNNKQRRQK